MVISDQYFFPYNVFAPRSLPKSFVWPLTFVECALSFAPNSLKITIGKAFEQC